MKLPCGCSDEPQRTQRTQRENESRIYVFFVFFVLFVVHCEAEHEPAFSTRFTELGDRSMRGFACRADGRGETAISMAVHGLPQAGLLRNVTKSVIELGQGGLGHRADQSDKNQKLLFMDAIVHNNWVNRARIDHQLEGS